MMRIVTEPAAMPRLIPIAVLAVCLASRAPAQAPPAAAEVAAPSASPSSNPGAEAESLHHPADYPGAAAFMNLETATVVYPTRSDVDVDVAKASALARARWLEKTFHMRVEVDGDDRITESQRKGNLLILGWGNRVWEADGLTRPFAHGPDGLKFLGLTEADPDFDLLLFHRNPLAWDSFVLFWSRIDPERDRIQPVPRAGSDWAIYRDFYPVRQGMFKPLRTWPPQRDETAEAQRSTAGPARPGRLGRASSEHYDMTFDKGTISDEEAKVILKAREAALQKAVAGLGPLPQGFRIQLGVYADETDKRQHSGVGDPTHAMPWELSIDMVRRYAHSTAPHEEAHVLARSLYGPCYATALCEGLAVAVEGSWHGKALPAYAAMLRAGKNLPQAASLLDEETLRALPDDVAFGASGAFVTWLRTAYGNEAAARVYALPSPSLASVARTLGLKDDALEAAWRGWADAQVGSHKSDLDFQAAEADAKERMKTGDWPGMAEALRRALTVKPGDPQVTFNLASAQMRAGDLAGAATTLKGLLASDLKPEEARFRVFGHYQLGRVYDLLGRREEALREYDAVLSLPDDHGSHSLATERKTTPATKDDLD